MVIDSREPHGGEGARRSRATDSAAGPAARAAAPVIDHRGANIKEPLAPAARTRIALAVLLAAVTIAVIVVLNLVVASAGWRIFFLLAACLMIATIVYVLPVSWRKRLGPVAAVFVAAAGTLSVFLVSPNAPDPVVDAQQMAHAVADGPFDQNLPASFQVGAVKRVGISDPSSAGKLVAVEVPVQAPGYQVFAEVEVYPSAQAAARRGEMQLKFLSAQYMPPSQRQTIAGFCIWRTPNAWVCGGVHGHAYAETTLSPGANATLAVTQDINSALLAYADDKAKLASHPG